MPPGTGKEKKDFLMGKNYIIYYGILLLYQREMYVNFSVYVRKKTIHYEYIFPWDR
jgi:hypothetical protein